MFIHQIWTLTVLGLYSLDSWNTGAICESYREKRYCKNKYCLKESVDQHQMLFIKTKFTLVEKSFIVLTFKTFLHQTAWLFICLSLFLDPEMIFQCTNSPILHMAFWTVAKTPDGTQFKIYGHRDYKILANDDIELWIRKPWEINLTNSKYSRNRNKYSIQNSNK